MTGLITPLMSEVTSVSPARGIKRGVIQSSEPLITLAWDLRQRPLQTTGAAPWHMSLTFCVCALVGWQPFPPIPLEDVAVWI